MFLGYSDHHPKTSRKSVHPWTWRLLVTYYSRERGSRGWRFKKGLLTFSSSSSSSSIRHQ
jgi:hypothetical protein